MARLVAPNDTMRQVEIQGARTGYSKTYNWSKDGTVHVESAAHIKALKDQGFTEAGVPLGTSKGQGFKCPECGRRGWFKTCGKCGCENGERE